jgi:hypothetical protein
MINNYKENMDKVLNIIKKGGIVQMIDYMDYQYNEDDLVINYYKPSILDYRIYSKNYHKLYRQLIITNYKNNADMYMRLLRFGKQNYLDYITYISYYAYYVCDICKQNKRGNRIKCMYCFEIDICNDCYKNNTKCIDCKKDKLFKYTKNNIFPKVSKITI